MINPSVFLTKLQSNQLLLRQTVLDDFEDLFKLGGSKKIWEQHSEKNRFKKENFRRYFINGLKNDLGCFTVVKRSNDKILGWTRYYDLNKDNLLITIGYTFIGMDYWGTQLNFNIKKLMIDYAFKHLEEVSFKVYNRNFRSQKAVLKLGAIFKAKTGDRNKYILSKKVWEKVNNSNLKFL